MEDNKQKEIVMFDKGDFHLACSCGHDEVIAKGIEGALQYVIPTTDTHKLEIQCKACLNKLTLYWTDHVEDDTKQTIESNEQVPQTNKEEESI